MVLGATVAQTLFGENDPVGQTVRVSVGGQTGSSFKVVGVLTAKGGTGFGNQDDQALIPITTMWTRLANQRSTQGGRNVQSIDVQAVDNNSIQEAIAEVGTILRQRHKVV